MHQLPVVLNTDELMRYAVRQCDTYIVQSYTNSKIVLYTILYIPNSSSELRQRGISYYRSIER